MWINIKIPLKEGTKNTNMSITKTHTLKQSVSDILLDISWAQISKKYFGKSRSWLNHKINGINSNGAKTEISLEEKEQLKHALKDLAKRIEACADSL